MSISENERYWQQRAKRAEERAEQAETECQRMRSIIAGDHSLYGDPEKLDSDMQEVLDGNRRRNYLSGEAKQAHGDARSGVPYVPDSDYGKRMHRRAQKSEGVLRQIEDARVTFIEREIGVEDRIKRQCFATRVLEILAED